MWYDFSLTIPAGTTEAKPEEKVLKLTYGIIHQVVVEAAPGNHREAKVRIYRFEHQIYPTNTEEAFALDSIPRDFEDRYELSQRPHELRVEGYAPDATYDHEYRIGIGIMAPEAFPEYREAETLIAKIARLMGIKK